MCTTVPTRWFKQVSPDGGTSRFWYDELSRLIVSQNAKQAVENSYSYTRYDSLNRVTQVGLKTVAATLAESGGYLLKAAYNSFLSSGSNSEITETVYDAAPGIGAGIESLTLDNPRSRVTASIYRETSNSSNINATYYSYDLAGNVKTLYQQVYGLGGSKRIDYEYDQVSGKVNFVAYQKNSKDKFFYAYKYDAENRLISSWTSTDANLKSYGFGSQLSEPYKSLDASYAYYLHGPLARLELGREAEKVQGIDYAYTLQGWLKGVNGSTLDPNSDIGKDAITGLNQTIGKDALAYSLGYYNGDYTPIGGGSAFSAYQSNSNDDSGKSLFNGNISNSTYDIAKIENGAVGYTYAYDQLNRIKLVRQRGGIGTNGWNFSAASEKFKETFTYDGNGNILTLTRNNDNGVPMDELTYAYNRDAGRLKNNMLMSIHDDKTGNSSYDVASNSYAYNEIGNLKNDNTEGNTIKWNVYGKIKQIEKGAGNIYAAYTYDASGNRVSKTIGGKTDWYVRDAQGNTLAEYSTAEAGESAGIWWREQHLYGSSRLGMWRPKINLATATTSTGNQQWDTYGNKFFELSNHLGNTMVVINDVRINNSAPFEPTVINANDYYAFGGQMPGRSFTLNNNPAYRYGFNGKENDNEVKGTGNQQDYGMRIYDPRIGRFLSVDPITAQYPMLTPYQFASNRPINSIDIDGEEAFEMVHWIAIVGSSRQSANLVAPTFRKVFGINEKQTQLIFGVYNGIASGFDAIGLLEQYKEYSNEASNELFSMKINTLMQEDLSFDRIKKMFPEYRMAEDSFNGLKATINAAYAGDSYSAGQVFGMCLTAGIGGLETSDIAALRGLGGNGVRAAEFLEALPETQVRYNNGYRTADGKFASPNGNQAPSGALAEVEVWNSVKMKPGWSIIEGRVYVKDIDGNVRVYDGVAQSPSGNNIGLEVKSNTSQKTTPQRKFDNKLNSSPQNKVKGTGKNKNLEVHRAKEIRKKTN